MPIGNTHIPSSSPAAPWPWIRAQQLPDPRLGLISHRPHPLALILRRAVGGQRRLHRVACHPHHPRHLRNRQLLRPAQPPDLAQSSTLNTRFLPWLTRTQGLWGWSNQLPRSGRYSVAADTIARSAAQRTAFVHRDSTESRRETNRRPACRGCHLMLIAANISA